MYIIIMCVHCKLNHVYIYTHMYTCLFRITLYMYVYIYVYTDYQQSHMLKCCRWSWSYLFLLNVKRYQLIPGLDHQKRAQWRLLRQPHVRCQTEAGAECQVGAANLPVMIMFMNVCGRTPISVTQVVWYFWRHLFRSSGSFCFRASPQWNMGFFRWDPNGLWYFDVTERVLWDLRCHQMGSIVNCDQQVLLTKCNKCKSSDHSNDRFRWFFLGKFWVY